MIDFNPPVREMDVLASAAAGMNVQRSMLDIAARNVAAAQAATPDHPFARLVAQISNAPDAAATDANDAFTDDGDAGAGQAGLPRIAGIRSEPGTGDALSEMIAVLDAQRSYEQNASVFDIGKRLAERTIDVGRT